MDGQQGRGRGNQGLFKVMNGVSSVGRTAGTMDWNADVGLRG